MTREEIRKKLELELCAIYCYNCANNLDEDKCGDCHRKYMNWQPSYELLEGIMDICGVAERREYADK